MRVALAKDEKYCFCCLQSDASAFIIWVSQIQTQRRSSSCPSCPSCPSSPSWPPSSSPSCPSSCASSPSSSSSASPSPQSQCLRSWVADEEAKGSVRNRARDGCRNRIATRRSEEQETVEGLVRSIGVVTMICRKCAFSVRRFAVGRPPAGLTYCCYRCRHPTCPPLHRPPSASSSPPH